METDENRLFDLVSARYEANRIAMRGYQKLVKQPGAFLFFRSIATILYERNNAKICGISRGTELTTYSTR